MNGIDHDKRYPSDRYGNQGADDKPSLPRTAQAEHALPSRQRSAFKEFVELSPLVLVPESANLVRFATSGWLDFDGFR